MMASLRLLIVEDSRVQLTLLTMLVEKFGFDVTGAESAEEALEVIQSVKFAAILMDISLPGMNGFDCAKHIRALEREKQLERTPIVALTAIRTGNEFAERCRDAEIDDYLQKPFDMEELRKILLRYTYTPKLPNLKLLPGFLDELNRMQSS